MFLKRLQYWLNPAKREAALRSEMEQHLEETIAGLRAGGLSASDAGAQAQRRFGNFGQKQEESREIWITRFCSDIWQDARYGWRSLAVQPGFTLAAVLALVLGIGVNAIVFNVYNALALAPWAIRDSKHTVQVLSEQRGNWAGFTWPHYRYLNENAQSFEGLCAFTGYPVRIGLGETSWTASAIMASENYFELVGTGFAEGRGFTRSSGNLREPAPEIVLHYDAWMNRFGGDRNIVGQWLDLSGHKLQVVGVAAAGFSGPTPTAPQLWIPAPWIDILDSAAKVIDNPDTCCSSVMGRLKPSTGRTTAQAELNTLSAQYAASVSKESSRVLLTDPSFLANPTSYARASPIFTAMGATALLILLLACANAANLQVARALARRREIAVRLSLGASRVRVIRQLMVESVLISSIAGVASIGLSSMIPGWVVRNVVTPGERVSIRFANDGRVVAFILFATFAAATLFGLIPAWGAVQEASGLREGGRATSSSKMRSVLIALQVALCAVLLSGTAMLVRALDRVQHLDLGFNYNNVLVLSTGLDSVGLNDEQSRSPINLLIERIKALPGVEHVAHAVVLPLGNRFHGTSVTDPKTQTKLKIGFNETSANFFETLRIPLLAGRRFTDDDEAARDKVILNQATADRLWPGENPLGKTVNLGREFEIIGVARNLATRGIGSDWELYAWTASKGTRDSRLLIRYTGDPAPLLATLGKYAAETDKRMQATVSHYSEFTVRSLQSAKIMAAVASVLGALALLLACVGIYGVASYNVSQQTREVGLRMALGAGPNTVLAWVLKQNLRMVWVGSIVGIAGAIGFGKLLDSFLYGMKPTDPISLLSAVGVLCVTALAATFGPARRASRIDPAITLRHD